MNKPPASVKNGRAEISGMSISRGEVWLVNLNPTIGTEIAPC
jgi:hypothetical protein